MRKDKKRRRWPQEIGLYGGEEPSERERVFRVRGIERGGTGSFPFISISPSLSLSQCTGDSSVPLRYNIYMWKAFSPSGVRFCLSSSL